METDMTKYCYSCYEEIEDSDEDFIICPECRRIVKCNLNEKEITITGDIMGIEGYTIDDVWHSPFEGCDKIEKINVFTNDEFEKIDLIWDTDDIEHNIFDGCINLKEVAFGEGMREIGDYAFKGMDKIEKISASTGLIRIGEGAFEGCKSLKEFEIPEFVFDIKANAFTGCDSLEKINIPGMVRTLNGNFKTKGLFFKKANYDKESDDFKKGPFYGCASLKKVVFEEGVENVQDYTFHNCPKLECVILPESLKTFGLKVTSEEEGNINIKEVIASEDVKERFENCFKL